MQVPFNKPYRANKESEYVEDVLHNGELSGNGVYTKRCQRFFEEHFGFNKCFLTTSCTDALEMAALLIGIKQGDEVILPSYTYVSSANAFALRGANLVFVDSENDSPNINADYLAKHITPKTKAILAMHYNGVSCDMNKIMAVANKHNLWVVEDAAQAINSYCDGKAVGTQGHLSAFSFHDTKNINSGEGGMLCINNDSLIEKAEVIWEKGTNRSAFKRGEVTEYNWLDIGSSFYPADTTAAILWAQLQELNDIQNTRSGLWHNYYNTFSGDGFADMFSIPQSVSNNPGNAHVFWLLFKDIKQRDGLANYLNSKGIKAVFHYLALHQSPYYIDKYTGNRLTNCEKFTNCLLRLPLYNSMTAVEQQHVINTIREYYNK